jgi:uncharacterized protein YecE (DUF72 family)
MNASRRVRRAVIQVGEQTTHIYLGCSGWHYDHWLGVLYDSRRRYLEQYARFFHSVEVNSTFYQFPKEGQLKKWHNATPDDFVFSVKMNRHITHTKRLRETSRALSDFFEICEVLGHKLGPFLVVLAPSIQKDIDRLDEFLSLLPDHRFAFEFRHDSWFSDDVFDRFRGQSNLALVMLGAQFDNNIACFKGFTYIRWHARGRDLDLYSSEELDYCPVESERFQTKLTFSATGTMMFTGPRIVWT